MMTRTLVESEVIYMLCERCKAKTSTRKQVLITCKRCHQEEYVPLYNDNLCKACNEKAGTCEECGRVIQEIKK